jgi:hypothetical protein
VRPLQKIVPPRKRDALPITDPPFVSTSVSFESGKPRMPAGPPSAT